ncbi:MAG: hypothetical protein GX028_03290, partial [Clostridiaceae bacterium]|nr:hypothetical protein [Clostridiaceae bacterium]
AAQAAAEQASTADAIREELDKVASRPAPDADDAALIGEALMKKEPVTENDDEESAQAEADNSDNEDTEENDSSTEFKLNLPDQGDAFPFKLAPPVEATEFINQNFDQEAEETEE